VFTARYGMYIIKKTVTFGMLIKKLTFLQEGKLAV